VTFDLDVKKSLVWRRIGIPTGSAAAELEDEFETAYDRARSELVPAHAHKLWVVATVARRKVALEGGVELESALVAKITKGADALAVMAATVGPGVDDLAEEYNVRGDVFAMMVADAVGSVAAEELMSRVHAAVAAEVEETGGSVTRRVSPGYGDFSLTYQPRLLELAGGAPLGITLTENYMMVPRKSVTAVAAVREK